MIIEKLKLLYYGNDNNLDVPNSAVCQIKCLLIAAVRPVYEKNNISFCEDNDVFQTGFVIY